MMWRSSLFVLCTLLAVDARAQDRDGIAAATSGVPAARFEIVQSPLAVRWTFRLDRYTGNVDLLVQNQSKDLLWEAMEVVALEQIPATKARFQLFLSGLAARHSYMIDTESGRTWELASGTRTGRDGEKHEVTIWQPLVRQ